MKKLTLTLALIIGLATQASAFDLGGYQGPVSLKFSGFSQSDDTTYFTGAGGTGETWAVFRVTTIEDPFTNSLWDQGDDDQYIYGFIWGITDDAVVVESGLKQIDQNGGHFAMYLYDDGDDSDEFILDPAKRTAATVYESVTDGGSLFLGGDLVKGINATEDFTVEQLFNFDSGQGSGEGFGDVTGGLAYDLFNSNGITTNQGTKADLNFNFDVSVQDVPEGLDFFAKIDDPIKAHAVPEPASMALFGTGLMGAFIRRKILG